VAMENIDALWNFDDAAQTEERFQKLIAEIDNDADTGWAIELLTQLARAQGLQRKFAEAHATLDLAQSALKPELKPEMQRALLDELTAAGEVDGYMFEEIGECLLALNHLDDAVPYFAKAYEALSRDAWLMENEPARMARLKALFS
jgi:tetratricopeptide (TPR) repeat protein